MTVYEVTAIYAAALLAIGCAWWGYARVKNADIRALDERCAIAEAACEPLHRDRNKAMTLLAVVVDTWMETTEAGDELIAKPMCQKALQRRRIAQEAHKHAAENAVHALYGAKPVSGVRRKTGNGEVRCG